MCQGVYATTTTTILGYVSCEGGSLCTRGVYANTTAILTRLYRKGDVRYYYCYTLPDSSPPCQGGVRYSY